MKTNEIYVSNDGEGWDEVLNETEKYAEYQNLGKKDKIHLRLLAEELLGMVKSIAGRFYAYFWIEDDDDAYYIHLKAKVNMDGEIRDAFIEASTSRKNAAAKGIMGKLKDIFQSYWIGSKDAGLVTPTGYYSGFSGYSSYETETLGSANMWSLSTYKNTVKENKKENDLDQWDELEKSIIANIADDVTVGIDGDYVEMIITRKNR